MYRQESNWDYVSNLIVAVPGVAAVFSDGREESGELEVPSSHRGGDGWMPGASREGSGNGRRGAHGEDRRLDLRSGGHVSRRQLAAGQVT